MQERIKQIKDLYTEAYAYNQAMNRASGRISAMKAELDEKIQSFNLKEIIIDIACSDGDAQRLTNELVKHEQLLLALETLTNKESEVYTTIDYKVKGKYRKPKVLLRTLVHEVIADDIDTDEVKLILNELVNILNLTRSNG